MKWCQIAVSSTFSMLNWGKNLAFNCYAPTDNCSVEEWQALLTRAETIGINAVLAVRQSVRTFYGFLCSGVLRARLNLFWRSLPVGFQCPVTRLLFWLRLLFLTFSLVCGRGCLCSLSQVTSESEKTPKCPFLRGLGNGPRGRCRFCLWFVFTCLIFQFY